MAGFGVRFEVTGADAVEHRLLGIGERAIDGVPVLTAIAAAIREKEKAVFDQEGPGWAPLAASTLESKTEGSKILEETGRLRDSLTAGSGEHVEHIGPDELIYGTSVPYATYLHTGTSRMPKRDPLPLTQEDMLAYDKLLQGWLIGLDRAEYGAGEFGMASSAGIFD